MKKILLTILTILLSIGFSINSLASYTASAANPKITIKNYKNGQFKYAVISGSKYASINAKMFNYTKKIYKDDLALQEQFKKELQSGYSSTSDTAYEKAIYCQKKFNNTKKISILCTVSGYTGGAHGYAFAKTFNLLNSKEIKLKEAFKDTSNYITGKRYAKQYMLNRPNKYPFAGTDTSIAGHPFYWTSNGATVIMAQYEVASYVEGMQRVPILKEFLK